METAFFDHLFHSTMRKATDCRLLLLVVWKFLTESDRAIGGGVKAATFLLSFCTPVKVPPTSNTACSLSSSSLIGPRTSKDAEEATPKKSLSSHWSTPRRKSQTVGGTAINPVTPERTALQAAVENFCGETLPVREMGEKNQHDYPPLRAASTERDESVTISENCSVALQVLMDLLMRQNQSDSSRLDRLETSILEADGLEVLAQLVTHAASLGEVTVLSHQVFSLLEVITVGPSVKMYTTQLSHCVDTVSALLPIKENPMVTAEVQLPPAKQEQERCSVSQRPILRTVDDELRVLRVLTNLTALDPYPGSEEATKRIGLYVRSVLLHPLPPEEDAERLTFVLCCAINAAKLECFYRQVPGKHTNTPFVSSLLPKDMESACVLKAMMRHLFLCYRSHTTEYLVIAGYYALLIGILSLVKYENKDLRVSIITVIAQTEKKDVAESTDQPMAIIVAIIQEFLLFQSNASALCETAFIEINEIVDHILIANKISLPET